MIVGTERAIEDYLRRLDGAAAHLPKESRTELVAEIRDHIDQALRVEGGPSEAATQGVLERLGRPEDIVAAARVATSEPAPNKAGPLEILAMVAFVVPFVGWLVGIVLTAASRAWSTRDKVIAVSLVMVPLVLLSIGFTSVRPDGGEEATPIGDDREIGVVETSGRNLGPLELLLFPLGLPSAVFLAIRLRRPRTDVG